ncbi:hypothetical protein JCM5350_000616 [Sporobolomyces pararoseus]
MDPYPDFATSSLTFSVSNLESLHTYQLVLIPFMSGSNSQLVVEKARTLFIERRRQALKTKEEGLGEKVWELKRLKYLKETLETGAQGGSIQSVRGSSGDTGPWTVEDMRKKVKSLEKENEVLKAQLEEKCKALQTPSTIDHNDSSYEARELYLPVGSPSLAESGLLTQEDFETRTPPSQSTTSLPSQPEPPSSPGPFFSRIERSQLSVIPQILRDQIYSISISNLPSKLVTPLLILHYLRSTQSESNFPRPVAISKSQSGNIWIGFKSFDMAAIAQSLLDCRILPGFHEVVPLPRCELKVTNQPGVVYPYRWHQLSDEALENWNGKNELPHCETVGEWVSKTEAPSSLSVVIVSVDYDRESRRILGLVSIEEAEEELRREREEDTDLQIEMFIRLDAANRGRDLWNVDCRPGAMCIEEGRRSSKRQKMK